MLRAARLKRIFGVLLLAAAASAAHAAPGRMPGALGASSDGAATYSIPIWTPPGPRGVQPSIALSYSSHSVNGIAGMGWSLGAASAIARCGRTIAQDGVKEGISFTTLGRFCLDGQRLRLISGDYGMAGSTYATELESYTQVRFAGSPGGFVVRGKDGLTYTYGSSANSIVLLFSSGPIYRWLLDRVSDDYGNSYTITYDNANLVAVASTITWAGYTATLEYSNSRTDADSERRYVPGGEILNRKRLESITIRHGGTTSRKYILGYDISSVTNRSRLRSVRECTDDAATHCLNATTFDYQVGTAGALYAKPHLMPAPISGKYDFNGDGRDDLLYAASGRLWVAIATTTGFDPGLDTGVASGAPYRIDEFVVKGRDSLLENFGGTLFHSRWNSATASFIRTATSITYTSGSMPQAVDTDGNGLVDLAYLISPTLYVRRNTTPIGAVDPSFGDAALAYRLDQQAWGRSDGQQWSAQNVTSQQTTTGLRHYDVDGDGRHDLYVIAAVGTPGPGNPPFISAFMLRMGGGVPPSSEWQPPNRNVPLYLNDDRCTDRLDNGAVVFVSSCDGRTGYTVTLPATPQHFLDWDGDGRTDFLVPNGTNYGVHRSTGNGAGALESTSIPAVSGVVMDQDGDGLDDFVTSGTYYTHSGTGSTSIYARHVPDLLSSVTDGNGVRYALEYVSIARENYASGTFPAGGPDANQAQVHPPEPAIVVGLVTRMDGIGGQYTQTYNYVGARYDTYRDASVGFQRIDVRDSRTGLITRTSYEQNFPLTGRVSQLQVLRDNGSKLLASVETVHRSRVIEATQYNERYYPWVEQVTQRTYEAEGPEQLVATSQVTINEADIDFQTGNTRLVTTSATSPGTSGASITSIRTDYFPAANNCLDLPERITSTQQVPGQPAIARVVEFTPDGSQCRHQTGTVRGANNDSHYDVTFTYGYDSFGNVSSVREQAQGPDAQGNYQPMPARESRWTYTGTNCGLAGIAPCTFTNALNHITAFEYYPETGLLKQQTDPNQLSTSLQYDAFGRASTIMWPDATSRSYVYSECTSNCPGGSEHVMTVVRTEKMGSTTISDQTIHLDRFERPIAAHSKLLGSNYQWRGVKYDAMGRLWKQSVPCISNATSNCAAVWSELLYDLAGRVRTIHRAGEAGTIRTTSVAYSGLRTTSTDPLGKVTQRLFDVLGHLRRSTDANAYAQIFNYDSAGSLLSVTEESGRVLFEASYEYGLDAFQSSARSYAQAASTVYRYDGFGQLRRWTDAKGQLFEMSYDPLSRPLTRRDNIVGQTQEALTNWIWGTGAQGAKDIGQLIETSSVSSDGTYREIHGYDSYGRPSQRTIRIPGEPAYVYDFEYSPTTGALDTLRFPDTLGTRFALKYGYDSGSGVLNEVRDANTGTVYWRLDALDLFGQTVEQFGNNVIRKRTFDPVTGWLEKLEAGPGSNPTLLQNASVLYDEVGNVQQRTNNLGALPAALVEDFTNRNDPLYRFKSGTVTANGAPAATLTIDEYDSLGNIEIKRDTSGLDSPLDYTVSWTGYNYPISIESLTMREKVSFAYGPDRQRWRMVYEDLASGRTETTFYAGLMEKVVIDDGGSQSTEYRYYIPAGAEPIAIHSRTSFANHTRYLLTDHLGSLDTVLDDAGNRLVSQSYSPYGLPRDPSAWAGASTGGSDAYTRQGYTFQTVLGRLGMNHMNGRVQDALTGQFLSPDPFVTEPGNTQNWNRYSYVYNNPLTFIDPSGFQTRPGPDDHPGPGSPFPGEPIDSRCVTPTGNVLSPAVCTYVTRQWGLGSTIAQGVTAKVRAEYERVLVGSTGAGTGTMTSNAVGTLTLSRWATGSFRLLSIGTAELTAAVTAPLLLFIPDSNPGGASSALYSRDDLQAPLGPLPSQSDIDNMLAMAAANANAAATSQAVVHGNSLSSTRQTHVYQLVSTRSGTILKYGITSEPFPTDRYPSYFYTWGQFTMVVLATYPTRGLARLDEAGRCAAYVTATGHLPPLSLTC